MRGAAPRSAPGSSSEPQVSSPPTIADSSGKSISAPGPNVVMTWLRRNCPCALPFIAVAPARPAWKGSSETGSPGAPRRAKTRLARNFRWWGRLEVGAPASLEGEAFAAAASYFWYCISTPRRSGSLRQGWRARSRAGRRSGSGRCADARSRSDSSGTGCAVRSDPGAKHLQQESFLNLGALRFDPRHAAGRWCHGPASHGGPAPPEPRQSRGPTARAANGVTLETSTDR